MYTVRSEKKALYVIKGELVALPIGLDLKLFETNSEKKAVSAWQSFGGEFSDLKVVKE